MASDLRPPEHQVAGNYASTDKLGPLVPRVYKILQAGERGEHEAAFFPGGGGEGGGGGEAGRGRGRQRRQEGRQIRARLGQGEGRRRRVRGAARRSHAEERRGGAASREIAMRRSGVAARSAASTHSTPWRRTTGGRWARGGGGRLEAGGGAAEEAGGGERAAVSGEQRGRRRGRPDPVSLLPSAPLADGGRSAKVATSASSLFLFLHPLCSIRMGAGEPDGSGRLGMA
ncbi:hypothetical protein OsJ_22052 [Oryza sativa Japonica Group]|uniref:Uncharacterized protein n=1 Tax=Oryza sativa subsp. japonica TaxID=39947 RepID=B9FQ14_ORYSJ|nr:hypothetical protein OsJ_22052 [Oryza sativa Japonica Group]